MKIIAGDKRGLHLRSLKGDDTRPTSGKVKESMFNIIGPFFEGGVVVELFGGSGALSLEALSRGADEAFIFEKSRAACAVIRENVEKCRYEDVIHIEQTDARNALKYMSGTGKVVDFLFLDPPYAEEKFYELAQTIVDANLLSDRAVIVCEHDKKTELPEAFGKFGLIKCNVYGNIALSIYGK